LPHHFPTASIDDPYDKECSSPLLSLSLHDAGHSTAQHSTHTHTHTTSGAASYCWHSGSLCDINLLPSSVAWWHERHGRDSPFIFSLRHHALHSSPTLSTSSSIISSVIFHDYHLLVLLLQAHPCLLGGVVVNNIGP
jgi:hypothetical protein